MDNVELSPATRWGMIATGLLQGLVCYLLIAWLAGKNHSWIVYGVPATVAFSSVLLFSVISFKQKRLWGWLALVFIATTGMSGWLKWQTDGMNPWRAEKAIWDFGCYLLLMAMLLLPWIQQSLRIRNGSSRYSYFYQSVWHNVLILLVIFLANGLTWLVRARITASAVTRPNVRYINQSVAKKSVLKNLMPTSLNNSPHSKSTSHVRPLARKITSNISTLCHTDW
ncbi:hypothetical protein AWG66_09130 [Escherichia coli]|nr:hypothetical protein AWG66_09130 [Escherichia coli]